MKKFFRLGIIILSLLISACGGTPATPTIKPVDVQNTAVAAAFTVVAETHAAIPTTTSPPPTETASPTPPPTNTPAPSPTTDLLATSPTIVPTFTSQPGAVASADPCNQPIGSWLGPSVSIAIDPEYKPQGKDDVIIVSLWVMTDKGECGFLSDISNGPVGQYSAAAYVDGKQDFKVFGGFRLSEGSWKLVIRNDSIVALGGCYPNC